MAVRLIEITAKSGYADTVAALAEELGALECRIEPEAEDGTRLMRLLARPTGQQELLDRLQSGLGHGDPWRITILPVDTTIPEPEANEQEKVSPETAIREELYTEIERGVRIDSTFVLLVVLSTLVAAIGLFEDSVAEVIGAMLIAPLLGPNMALAFGSALGDRELILRAFIGNAAGLGLSIAGAAAAGLLLPMPSISVELLSRTTLGYDSVALALASGAAGAVSLTTRLSSTLVGVMVAVALLPPAATLGFTLGQGSFALAIGAAALLAVNIVCVNLAAQIVFLAKGVKPRTWLERRAAQQSTVISLVVWSFLLLVLLVVIAVRRG